MKYFIHLPMMMEPIVSSETSAIRTQDAGELPKKEQITFRTRRKLKNKKETMLLVSTFAYEIIQEACCVPIRLRSWADTSMHLELRS